MFSPKKYCVYSLSSVRWSGMMCDDEIDLWYLQNKCLSLSETGLNSHHSYKGILRLPFVLPLMSTVWNILYIYTKPYCETASINLFIHHEFAKFLYCLHYLLVLSDLDYWDNLDKLFYHLKKTLSALMINYCEWAIGWI